MAKIKDVARAAGVSAATVSRTLAGSPRVSTATRTRVLAAVTQLNYRPDEVARSLRRRRTNLIGLVVSTIENRFFTEVAHAAEQAAHEQGYHLIVCNTNEDPVQEQMYLQVLDQQLVAGIILAPAPGEAAHLGEYVAKELPIVLINRQVERFSLPTITSDDEQAALQCVAALIQQGKRRIAAIKGLPATYTTERRLRGYRRALALAGLASRPDLEAEGHASLDGGYAAAMQLLTSAQPPDALFAFNNLMVQGAVMALQELGLRWPDDIDVAGFGGTTLTRLYRPRLNLVEQPTREMGCMAVQLLIDRLHGMSASSTQHVILHNRLVLRGAAPSLAVGVDGQNVSVL